MAWIILVMAGIFEMLGVIFINKFTHDKHKGALIYVAVFFILSFISLTYVFNFISMSTAYAIWTGIGAVGGALSGIVFFNESRDVRRVALIGLILVATIGLKLVS